MIRRIASWKYGIAVAIVVGLSIYVSHQDQKTREQYEQKCTQLNAGTAPPASHTEDCDQGADNAARHLPRWYRMFGWPEGITAWAILLTLFTVAEQTNATRTAAEATRDAMILQHRPKVVVRALTLGQNRPGTFDISLGIRNSGSTTAYVEQSNFQINWIANGKATIESHNEIIAATSLKAGEVRILHFTAPEFYVLFEASRILLEKNPDQLQRTFLGCFAYISYTDEIGTRRDTALNRTYTISKKEFEIWDKEKDYSD